jgi:hypothetical protein
LDSTWPTQMLLSDLNAWWRLGQYTINQIIHSNTYSSRSITMCVLLPVRQRLSDQCHNSTERRCLMSNWELRFRKVTCSSAPHSNQQIMPPIIRRRRPWNPSPRLQWRATRVSPRVGKSWFACCSGGIVNLTSVRIRTKSTRSRRRGDHESGGGAVWRRGRCFSNRFDVDDTFWLFSPTVVLFDQASVADTSNLRGQNRLAKLLLAAGGGD